MTAQMLEYCESSALDCILGGSVKEGGGTLEGGREMPGGGETVF